jgi:hypothetical protein
MKQRTSTLLAVAALTAALPRTPSSPHPPPSQGAPSRGIREVPRGPGGKTTRRAVRGQGRGHLEEQEAARTAPRWRKLRPRPWRRRRQGRLRARCRATSPTPTPGHGCRAAHRLVHGRKPGLQVRGHRQEALQQREHRRRTTPIGHHLRRRPVAQHEDRHAAEAPEGSRNLQIGKEMASPTAPAPTTSPAPPATAPTASASARRTCPTCGPRRRIRAYQGWPGYRMTGGFMLTQQWRMNDCFRQQRFPEPSYASDSITALLAYMTGHRQRPGVQGPGHQALRRQR